MKTFNIAMVGCGGVSRMHLDGYKRHPERVAVVAACDSELSRAQQAAQEYGIPAVFAALEQMIGGAQWDVAVVCTPTAVREPVVKALAAAGKHVFVEKPLADSYAEARRMVETCDGAGVRLAVNQNFRYHYPFQTAREIMAAGAIGPVSSILHQDLFFRQDSGWRTTMERHALAVMGIHWLDGFRWMLDRDAVSLVCQTASSPTIECAGETEASVQITFDGGAMATYVQSFSSACSRTETLVIGERGTLQLNYDGAALYTRAHGREPQQRWDNPYAGANKPDSAFAGLDHLLTAIEQGSEPPNSGRDNLKTVALLEGAYRSTNKDRVVQFHDGLPRWEVDPETRFF